MKNLLKEFGLTTSKNKKNDLLSNLYAIPKREKSVNMPHFQPKPPGQTVQADLLFMPSDRGFKYILVVVDTGNKALDAEPLKSKEAEGVVRGLDIIFKRKYVDKPHKIEVDAGSEFKGKTRKWFDKNNIKVRVAEVGRHRQQALVERANQTIGSILFKRMTAQEILTGSESRHWTRDLPKLMKLMNAHIKERDVNVKIKTDGDVVCEGDSCNILDVGDKVRVALEFPINPVTHEKLNGKFRSSDIRWHPDKRIIRQVLLKPDFPPMYLLDGNVGTLKVKPIAYTKEQLQLVPKNEKLPNVATIRGKPKAFIAQNIVDKKKIKGKIHYKVKWFGFPESESTYEPLAKLITEVPDLIKKYEASIKG